MTNKGIKDKIELEFGWLSPDEKQKLYILVISVYNSGVDASASVANEANKSAIGFSDGFHGDGSNYLIGIPKHIERLINALKLKL